MPNDDLQSVRDALSNLTEEAVIALAREIAVRLSPDALMDLKDIGAHLGVSAETVSSTYVNSPGFPQSFTLTTKRGVSHPRWLRSHILAWVKKHVPKTGGRPRNSGDVE